MKKKKKPDIITSIAVVGGIAIIAALAYLFSSKNHQEPENEELTTYDLEIEMWKYADAGNFEKAAEIRDLIKRKQAI